MSNKPRQKNILPHPRIYKEIKSLSLEDLKSLCEKENISWKGIGRFALEIIVCEKLGISTIGPGNRENKQPRLIDHCLDDKELKEFECLTPSYVQSLDGWTKNIKSIPDLDIGTVKKYLIRSDNPEFTKESLKKYKLSRSYSHLQAKHINSVEYNELKNSDTFCIVKAQCLPSQSGDSKQIKWLHVILDKRNGDPYGAFCVCTVGHGQACSHVGALLFLLTELIANGEETLPDEACTDLLCQWTFPKGAKVIPKPLQEVSMRQKEENTQKPGMQQNAPNLSNEDNYQRVLKLLFVVRNANKISAMPPIVNIIDVDKFRMQPLPSSPVQTNMPDECTEFELPINSEKLITSYPLPVYKFPHKIFESEDDNDFLSEKNRYLNSISLTKSAIDKIEMLTRGQSLSQEWFEHRKGCITGSKVGKIVSFFKGGKTNPDCIVRDIMQYKLDPTLSRQVPALAWGLKNESRALNDYMKDLRRCKKCDLELIRPGLLVSLTHPFIRVSPDAFIHCSCHGKYVVEVKCPYKFRNKDINESAREGLIDYITYSENQMVLKKGHSRGYYEQITLQQALSNGIDAQLLIWSKINYVVITMRFDKKFWEETMLPSLTRFFNDHVVNEILTERLKNEKICSVEEENTEATKDEEELVINEANIIESVSESSDDDLPHTSASASTSNTGNSTFQEEFSPIATSSNDSKKLSSDGDSANTDQWTLGCEKYCKDSRAPTFSTVKGEVIACDANLFCGPNTWFHLFCEGFRRMPSVKQLSANYVCQSCRVVHPNRENLETSNGFFSENGEDE